MRWLSDDLHPPPEVLFDGALTAACVALIGPLPHRIPIQGEQTWTCFGWLVEVQTIPDGVVAVGPVPSDIVARRLVPGDVVPGDVAPGDHVPDVVVPGWAAPAEGRPGERRPVDAKERQILPCKWLAIEDRVQCPRQAIRRAQTLVSNAANRAVGGGVRIKQARPHRAWRRRTRALAKRLGRTSKNRLYLVRIQVRLALEEERHRARYDGGGHRGAGESEVLGAVSGIHHVVR